jgi:general secretion pathway protein L
MPADRDPAERASARFQRAAGRRAGLNELWRWWLSELAPLVPRATRAALRRRRMRPVFAFEGDTATLWVPTSRATEIVMEPRVPIVLSGDAAAAAGRAAIDSLAGTASAGSTAPRVVIALPGRQTLRRTLSLPAALEENLKQALAYDLDRHTPFKADELYFDAAIVGRDTARGEIRVDLAAARRAVVDQALQAVEGWGGQVVAVVPDDPAIASASRLNLLPEDRRLAAGSWRRWQVLAPIGLLAAIALIGLALPIWQKREYAIALGRQVDAARAQAAVSEGVRTELERLTSEYNFALERKYAYPPTVQVLDEITKLLPDDTWLTQMELKTSSRGKDAQRELMLRGESGNAGRLITLFEESKVFAQAAPRSPTTKIQPGPGEIFDLVAQLRPLPAPAPVTVATAAAEPVERAAAPPRPAADPAVPKIAPTPDAAPSAPLPNAGATATPAASPGAGATATPAPATPPPASTTAAPAASQPVRKP